MKRFLIVWFLCILMLPSVCFAGNLYEPAEIWIPVECLGGDVTVRLMQDGAEADVLRLSGNSKDTFYLSFMEPGKYSYMVYGSDRTGYLVDVYVESGTDGSLSAQAVMYSNDGSSKLEILAFGSLLATEETNPGEDGTSPVENPSYGGNGVTTGDTDILSWIWALAIVSGSVALFLICKDMRKHK